MSYQDEAMARTTGRARWSALVVQSVALVATLAAAGCSEDGNPKPSAAGQAAVAGAAAGAGAADRVPGTVGSSAGAAQAAGASSAVDTPSSLPALCSGCASEQQNKADKSIHLHHIHMKVGNRAASTSFYEKHLAARRVTLNGTTEALHATPILLLLDETPTPPVSRLPTALQHVGWGAKDVSAWYEMAHAQGVAPDTRGGTLFNTLETPTVVEPDPAGTAGIELDVPGCFPQQESFSYMYVLGPDQERIEVWTGEEKRVNHVHFTASDVLATATWYQQFLGLSETPTPLAYSFLLDDALFFFEAIGDAADYQPTDDQPLSHVAFSVTDLQAWMKRANEQNIEIVSPPAEVHGFKSFFVRGPDGILIELVQAAPSQELCGGTGPFVAAP